MSAENSINLIGHLTRDAEARDKGPIRFSIANNRRVKHGDSWSDEASFFDIEYWHRSILQHLVKGKQVAIHGELKQERWEKDGQTRSKVVIAADSVKLLGGTSDRQYQQEAPEPSVFDDDIPF